MAKPSALNELLCRTLSAIRRISFDYLSQPSRLMAGQRRTYSFAKDVFEHVTGTEEVWTNFQKAERNLDCVRIASDDPLKGAAVTARESKLVVVRMKGLACGLPIAASLRAA